MQTKNTGTNPNLEFVVADFHIFAIYHKQMDFEFKHGIWLLLVSCCAWALLVSGMVSIEIARTNEARTELPGQESREMAPERVEEWFGSVSEILNLALPVAGACLVLLLFTYPSNPIGLLPLVIAIAAFWLSSSRSVETARWIDERSSLSLDTRVWWK